MRAGIAIHSPHTAFDSAKGGINQRLAAGLGLTEIRPLSPTVDDPDQLGSGRYGRLPSPLSLAECAARLKQLLAIDGLHAVGAPACQVQRIAIACGSAGSFLPYAREAGADLFVTGETSFHICLEAEAHGIAMLLPGHYASERFAVVALADVLAQQFPQLNIWPSRDEADPLQWI
jgi:putative NIF3 family GTP cyclohydrolase 1 type 2